MKKIIIGLASFLGASLLILVVIGVVRGIYQKRTAETKEFQITESYNKIEIDVETYNINIHLSDKGENKAVYKDQKKNYLVLKVENETLKIEQQDNRKFYEKFFSFDGYDLDLYLTKTILELLDIESTTGNIEINKEFQFNNVQMETTTGNIDFLAKVTNKTDIEVTTGNIKLVDCETLGDVEIESSTGNVTLENCNPNSLSVELSTGKTKLINVIVANNINIEGSTGDVIFDGIDAANIYVELSTGDVEGTILSSKFFVAKSDTGDVDVPETRDGGECRIRVSTGDIDISYK